MPIDSLPQDDSVSDAPALDSFFVARGLTGERGDKLLFRDVDFSLDEGQLLLIEGDNGSGKTTLLRILCGLIEPEEGEVYWQGDNIRLCYSDYLNALCYVGHSNGIKPGLTAQENLLVNHALAFAKTDQGIDTILEKIDLDQFSNILVQNLSAGQRRRLALARLLICFRKIWILDEPFTSLDKISKERMNNIFKEHLAAGGMIIMTSHDPVLWEDIPITSVSLS